MARPRVHDQDEILDAAEAILAGGDPAALTIRALAERTGAPSGSLYHAFGSRTQLLGRMWLRAARRFLDEQRRAVEAARAAGGSAVDATVAAALTLAVFRRSHPDAARVLGEYRRESLVREGLPAPIVADLAALDDELLVLLRELADGLWQRRDRRAIETVAVCLVDLPSVLFGGERERIVDTEAMLRVAVEAILATPPERPRESPRG